MDASLIRYKLIIRTINLVSVHEEQLQELAFSVTDSETSPNTGDDGGSNKISSCYKENSQLVTRKSRSIQ